MDNFTRHYIIAALWSSDDGADPEGGEPMDWNYSADDLAPEALARITADCAKFQAENAADLAEAYKLYAPHPDAPTPECSAGHDFWFTRNGLGVGFWDRGMDELGERLSEAARAYGVCDLYIGDDGKIYAA